MATRSTAAWSPLGRCVLAGVLALGACFPDAPPPNGGEAGSAGAEAVTGGQGAGAAPTGGAAGKVASGGAAAAAGATGQSGTSPAAGQAGASPGAGAAGASSGQGGAGLPGGASGAPGGGAGTTQAGSSGTGAGKGGAAGMLTGGSAGASMAGSAGTSMAGSAGAMGAGAAGATSCAAKETFCPGTGPGTGCVDVKTDEASCGVCGNPCAAGQTCKLGVCVCPTAREIVCGGGCVDPNVSGLHCGACDNACAPSVVCQAGHCVSEWAEWKLPGTPGVTGTFELMGPGQEIARDTVTTLQWQRTAFPSPSDWAAAMKKCDELELAGFDDWRLPTMIELASIVRFGAAPPSIDGTAFPGASPNEYWTRSPAPGGQRWRVTFYGGGAERVPTTELARARCVR